jgi:predicted dehydrogenase
MHETGKEWLTEMPIVRVGFIGAGNMANDMHYPSVADIPEAMLRSV